MSRSFKLGCAFVAAMAIAPLALPLPAVADGQSYPTTAKWAKDFALTTGPGISVSIGHGDDDPVFISQGTLRYRKPSNPVDGDTLWRMYSMTKPITALAALAAIDDGVLKLDDPLSKYFPKFADVRVFRINSNGEIVVEAGRPVTDKLERPITVLNLLTHTAGFGYSLPTSKTNVLWGIYALAGLNPWQVNKPLEYFSWKGHRLGVAMTRPLTLQLFADRLATVPLLAQPGTKWVYSESLDLLAAVIEKATGVPYAEYVQTRLFKPMNMASTYWQVPPDESKRLAVMFAGDENEWLTDVPELQAQAADELKRNSELNGHWRKLAVDPFLEATESQWLLPPMFPYGGAGLVMSARDYDTVLRMLLNKGRVRRPDGKYDQVLKSDTVELAIHDLLPKVAQAAGGVSVDVGDLKYMFRATGEILGFGAAGFVVNRKGTNCPCRAAGSYGWGGAAGTVFWIDPATGIRVTGMINHFGSVGVIDPQLQHAVYTDVPSK